MNRFYRLGFASLALALAILLLPVAGNNAFAQVLKGSISGTVTDPQGAVVSGAQIKATQIDTGSVLTTTSDSSGLFRFNLIPAGTYKVEISYQGFKTSVENNVPVTPGVDRSLGSVKLAVGESATTVEVSAATAPLIETTTSQVTNIFSGPALTTFVGIQENEGLDNLALFVPGVSSVRDISFSNTNGGGGFSVNGLRGRSNDQEIDGQNNNDNSVGGPGLFLSDTEFVGQYVIVTNNFGPEYGRNAGSVVNVITKSGTNAWHGSVYGTEESSWLNSMSNFDKEFNRTPGGAPLTKPARLNNEFGGGTVGGPWVKNKMFMFGGFDQQIIETLANLHSDSLTPTPAGLAQLSACFPASQSLQALEKFGPFGISGGGPIPTTVPLNPSDPNSARAFVPLNVTSGTVTCSNVQFGGVSRFLSQPVHGFNWTLKQDILLGSSDTVTARYLFNRGNFFNLDFGDGAAGYPVNVPALSQIFLLSETHNFSARMANEARVSFGRLNVDFGGNSIGTVPTAGQLDQAVTKVTFLFSSAAGLPFLSPFGAATNLPQQRIVNTWQGQDNWNYVHGKHNFKAGVNFTYQRSPNIFLPNIDGSYRFSNFNSFISNTPQRVRIANGASSLDFREYDTFLYVGDDWKIGQNLTLNLGLTWTYYGQPENLFNRITTARESNAGTAFWSATEPIGNPPGSGGPFLNPGAAIPLSGRTDPLIPAVNKSFGPSLGFAYSPQWGGFLTGHGKTTFRGGYRMLYDPPFYNIFINVSTSAPFVFLQTVASPGTHPLPLTPTGPNVRAALASSITKGAFDPRTFAQVNTSSNFGPDKVHSYTFGFEREVTKNSAFEARYSGNRAYDLFQSVNGNPFIADLKTDFPSLVPAGLTPCPASQAFAPVAVGRINCNQGVVLSRNNGGYSYYNSLQMEFRANNLFKQLTVRSSYTWSKTLDNVSEIFSTAAGGNTLAFAQSPVNSTKGEYSFSGLDIPHQWTILFNEQLPFFKEQHGFVGHLLGGWALSGNYIIASGQRYTPLQIGEAAFTSCLGTPSTCTGSSNGDYYDFFGNSGVGFGANFVGIDTARPFIGNLSAAQTSVGIFAGDMCNFYGFGCTLPVNQLVSFNSLNVASLSPTFDPTTFVPTSVTKDQVRFIVNGGEAQSIFGTPFGARRNLATDAKTNVANFSVFKRIKFSEHTSFEFHATALNVFNHPNFQSIDAFMVDAGLHAAGTGFGDPTVTNTVTPGSAAPATRQFLIGGTLRF
jgi:hypothetical protein